MTPPPRTARTRCSVRTGVFSPDEATAIAAGYRPCAVCLPDEYARWKTTRESSSASS
jgi:methylphosphotriester-DNA--protein-cysteine methyltransferase